MAGRHLADFGAEVIRVEEPGGAIDRSMGPFFTARRCNMITTHTTRHKKSITLDMRSKGFDQVLERLVKEADIIIHNFPVRSRQAKQLNYERLKEIKSDIILLAVSGFGQTGPNAHRNAFDAIGQAVSGGMDMTGVPDGPPMRVPYFPFDDMAALYGTIGLLIALRQRDATGQGQMIDSCVYDAAVSSVWYPLPDYQHRGVVHRRIGNQGRYTLTNSFPTKDGWVIIGMPTDHQWKAFCKMAGKEELIDDPRFNEPWTRWENHDEANAIITAWTSQRTKEKAVAEMEKYFIPCGAVVTIEEAFKDPHAEAREMIQVLDCGDGESIQVPGFPCKLSLTPADLEAWPPPNVGEHNEEVYRDVLGYSEEEIAELQKDGII